MSIAFSCHWHRRRHTVTITERERIDEDERTEWRNDNLCTHNSKHSMYRYCTFVLSHCAVTFMVINEFCDSDTRSLSLSLTVNHTCLRVNVHCLQTSSFINRFNLNRRVLRIELCLNVCEFDWKFISSLHSYHSTQLQPKSKSFLSLLSFFECLFARSKGNVHWKQDAEEKKNKKKEVSLCVALRCSCCCYLYPLMTRSYSIQ